MLPSLTRKDLVEGLPVIISTKECDPLLVVLKLTIGTREKQADNMTEWSVQDSVFAGCCDNKNLIQHISKVCMLQFLRKYEYMIFFLCRHHVYELILR